MLQALKQEIQSKIFPFQFFSHDFPESKRAVI